MSSSPSDGGKPWDIPGDGEALPTADDDDDNLLPPVWSFTVSVGEVFAYAFPVGTFHPNEDLELVLIGLDNHSRSWIKVDPDARKLYGLPLERDAGGAARLVLVGRDSRGEIRERYEVEVAFRRRLNSDARNHEVRVDLDAVFDQFVVDVDQRIDVATRIAHAHGDRDAADVKVARILRGSVAFFWSNRSLADGDPCPTDELNRIADCMIRSDGLLDPDFARAMRPHVVRSVKFTPKGTCVSQMNSRMGTRTKEDVEEEAEEETGSDPGLATSVDGLLITTIVPILILLVVVILVLIVVCVVCARRKKNRNKNKTEKEEEKEEKARRGGGGWEAASRKGVPVIFADELDEIPAAAAATGPPRALTVTSSSSGERRPMMAAFPSDYDRPTGGQSPSSPTLVPGRDDQDVTMARRRNSPPAYNNAANHPTATATATGTGTETSTPHHRRIASGGSRARQASRDPPPYVSC